MRKRERATQRPRSCGEPARRARAAAPSTSGSRAGALVRGSMAGAPRPPERSRAGGADNGRRFATASGAALTPSRRDTRAGGEGAEHEQRYSGRLATCTGVWRARRDRRPRAVPGLACAFGTEERVRHARSLPGAAGAARANLGQTCLPAPMNPLLRPAASANRWRPGRRSFFRTYRFKPFGRGSGVG